MLDSICYKITALDDQKKNYLVTQNTPHSIYKHSKCDNPKVSVVVPVYKVDKYLTQCLNSVVNQTLEELEIIIVDEGDQDRCREIIDFFEKHDPRIIAPHQKNGGYGASCNLGIDMARGEYIAIVESDDWIEPEMCEEMYAYAKALNADVVKTPYSEYFSNGSKHDCHYRNYVTEACPNNQCFSVKEFGALMEVHASLWSGIYKTSYMRQNNIRFIQAKGGAYVDVGFRIDTLIHTDRCAWLNKPFYNYRVDAEGSTTNNFKLGPMIQRWTEEHEMFSKCQENYDKYFGPHIIVDEYYNTVGWLSLMSATNEEFAQIQRNMDYVNESVIITSPALSDTQKKELLLFKKNPRRFKCLAAKKRFQHKYGRSILAVLERLCHPFLLLYFLACFLATFFIRGQGNTAVLVEGRIWDLAVKAMQLVGIFGIMLCCLGKITRKIIQFIFDR